MDAAIDTLEALFKKADTELELIKTRLSVNFGEQFSSPENQELNPMVLVPRIQRAHCKFAQLSAERAQIHEEMKVVSVELASLTAENCRELRALQALAGQTAEVTDDEAMVCTLAGLHLPDHSAVSSVGEISSSSSVTDLSSVSSSHDGSMAMSQISTGSNRLMNGPIAAIVGDSSSDHVGQESSSFTPGFTTRANPASQRLSHPDTFFPITEEEFLSVSSLVRGRAKLDEVNQVYHKLFDHFRSVKKQEALTVPKMNEMGLRITGATGQAKLKILRALKIIHMSKTNAVKLL